MDKFFDEESQFQNYLSQNTDKISRAIITAEGERTGNFVSTTYADILRWHGYENELLFKVGMIIREKRIKWYWDVLVKMWSADEHLEKLAKNIMENLNEKQKKQISKLKEKNVKRNGNH